MKYIFLSLLFTASLSSNTLELPQEYKDYLQNKHTITMCVDPDWEPFEQIVLTPNGPLHVGISADIINLVAQRLGITIELVNTQTWAETLAFSKEKKCNILSFLNQTHKRDEWLIFTKPLFEDPNVLVARREQTMIEDLSKVNLSIALLKDTAIYEQFSKDFPNLVFIPVDTEEEAFKLVEEKKADLTLRSLIVTAYVIKKEGLFNLKIVGKPKAYTNILRMGVSKDEVMLRDILNLGISSLTHEDINNIVNKHVQVVVQEVNNYTIGFYFFIALVCFMLIIAFWNYTLQKKIKTVLEKHKQQSNLLFEKNKQIELSTLVGNISHQFRDSLSKISYINLAIMAKLQNQQTIPNPELDKATKQIEGSIEFMSDTLHTFLDFYRPSAKMTCFSIFESMQEILLILDTKLKQNNVTVEFKIKNNMTIQGIKNEWMQVWLNIFNNTIHQGIEKKIHKISILVSVDDNLITFEDTCLGFDTLVLEQFNNNACEGLGLKMCQNILEKYQWNFAILNTSKGAMIKIYH